MKETLRTLRNAALALALLASAADASVILLKDGSRVEGTIVSATAREIVVYTENGTVRLDSDRIQSIDYAGAAPPAPASEEPRRAEPSDEDLFGPRSQSLSFDFGLAAPLNDVDFSAAGGGRASNGDLGALFGFQYLKNVSARTALGAEFQYANRTWTDSPGLLPNADSRVSGDSLMFLAELKYSLTERGSARPYVLLGAGAHRTSLTVDAQPVPGFVWSDTNSDEARRLVDGSAWGAAFAARVGVDVAVSDPMVLAFEAGWMGTTRSRYGATPAGKALGLSNVSAPLHLFTLAVRWGWRF